MSEPTIVVNADNSVHFLLTFLICVYYSFNLISGFWAEHLLPSTCTNQTLKTSIRMLIALNTITTTMYICLAVCKKICHLETTVEQLSESNLVKSADLGFVIVVALINIYLLFTIQSNFKSCYYEKIDNYTEYNKFVIGMSFIMILMLSLVIVYRAKSDTERAERMKHQEQLKATADKSLQRMQEAYGRSGVGGFR